MTAHQQHPNEGPTDGNVGSGNDVIELVSTEEVQGEQIVTAWFCSFKSKLMTIKFNGRYQNKLLDSIPVDLEDMRDMVEGFRNILENNGIAEEHITMLENILISNNPRIAEFYTRKTIEQTTEGQRRKKERVDKLRNTPPREVSVAQALMIREAGTNVRVTGKLIGRLVVENMIEIAAFRCANCDEWNILEDYRDTRPRLQSEMPSDFESKNLHKKMCKICLSDKIPHMSDHKYIPARSVELHGEEISNDIPYINIYLFNNCTINVLYNELVKVTGSIQQIRVKDKLLPHVFVGLESDGSIINGIAPIEPVEKEESIKITPKDEQQFQEFRIKKGDNFRQVFDALASLVAPHHQGHDNVKKGLLMSAVMTGIDSPRRKRRIDIMFIGPTGTDKSGLASEAKRLVPGSDTASAADSTSNSLICVYDKDREHFNFGKIPLGNGKILHLDEMGLWKPEDQQRVLSSMQEGRIIWARFGINKEIQASVSYVITANANSKSGKFRDQDKIDIQSESPFLGPILGRIDLIYIFRKEHDMKYLQGLAHSLTEMDNNYSESLQNEGHNYQFLTRWIEYGKRFENPKFSPEASIMLNQYFVNVRSQDNEVSDRLWRRLRNMAISLARLDHKNTVELEHAKIVVDLYNEQLRYWSQVAVIPPDVGGQAAHEMINKLEGQKIAFEAEELLKAVCKDNKTIDDYVRPDKTKEYDWSTASNHRVRDIHLRFKEIIAMDARISTIHKVPLTVAWSETYTGDTTELRRNIPKDVEIDGFDLIDLGNPQEKNNLVDKSETSTNKKNSDKEFLKSNTSNSSNSPTTDTGITGDIASDKLHQSINDFFSSDVQLPDHSLEESPCFPIVDSKSDKMGFETIYYCKLHPEVEGFLTTIESHCWRIEPEIHKAAIIESKRNRSPTSGGGSGNKGKVEPRVMEESSVSVNAPKSLKSFNFVDPVRGEAEDYDGPYAAEPEEQESVFFGTFRKLASRNKKGLVSGEKFRELLVSSGKFFTSDAAMMIRDALKEGHIEEVSGLIKGVPYDTYRWVEE